MAKRADLTGHVFGKLTALRPGPPLKKPSGRTVASTWVCECACGTPVFLAQTALLLNGHQTSCKCVSYVESLTGKRFGKLTVLRQVDRRHVACVCDCNKDVERIVDGAQLRSGNTSSCGKCSRRGRVLGPVALHMFRGEERTVDEIATALGISNTAVYNRIKSGRELDSPPTHRSGKAVTKTFVRGADHKNTKRYNVLGRPMTFAEVAETVGISESALLSRMSKHHISIEEAALWRPGVDDAKTLFGEPITLAELAVIAGRSVDRIRAALKAGATPEEAAFGRDDAKKGCAA